MPSIEDFKACIDCDKTIRTTSIQSISQGPFTFNGNSPTNDRIYIIWTNALWKLIELLPINVIFFLRKLRHTPI